MSDADSAYAAAQKRIAEEKAERSGYLDLDKPETRALETLPPEIAELSWLTRLDLGNTQVSDISHIAQMTGLTWLDLRSTQVSDISHIAQMTAMTTLYLGNTQVSDMRPLRRLQELADAPFLSGLTFADTPATVLDTTLAELAAIEDKKERGGKTLSYLNSLNDADYDAFLVRRMAEEGIEPEAITNPPAQSPSGMVYSAGPDGRMGYDPRPAKTPLSAQAAEMHALLLSEVRAFLEACPTGHNSPFLRLSSRLEAYEKALAAGPEALSPQIVWKAGDRLRTMLANNDSREANGFDGMPRVTGDLLDDLTDVVGTTNVFFSLHPEIEALDTVQADAVTRRLVEANAGLIDEFLLALEGQSALILDILREDLREIHREALGEGGPADRAAAIEKESLENLIKAIMVEAAKQTKDPSLIRTLAGDARGALVGAGVTAGLTLAGPQAAQSFLEVNQQLQPYISQLLSAWHGQGGTLQQGVDWLAAMFTQRTSDKGKR